jgi:hypothetical protein
MDTFEKTQEEKQAESNREGERLQRERIPEGASLTYMGAGEIFALHFSQEKGFSEHKLECKGEGESLHIILMDLGYIPDYDMTLPLEGEGEYVECIEYKKREGDKGVFVRDSTPIFTDTAEDMFALKAKLAPWLLLTWAIYHIAEWEKQLFGKVL